MIIIRILVIAFGLFMLVGLGMDTFEVKNPLLAAVLGLGTLAAIAGTLAFLHAF